MTVSLGPSCSSCSQQAVPLKRRGQTKHGDHLWAQEPLLPGKRKHLSLCSLPPAPVTSYQGHIIFGCKNIWDKL